MGFESSAGPESFGPKKEEYHDSSETSEEKFEKTRKMAEEIRNWWFGDQSEEAEKKQDSTKAEEGVEENKKETAEKILINRGSLFQRVTGRILEEREKYAEETENMTEGEQKMYEFAKQIPLVRGGFVIMEGLTGAEPGRRLDTKDALVKIGTGSLMYGADILSLITKVKTGKFPENVFKGKTLETMGNLLDKAKKKDPESKKTVALGAVNDFLKENGNTVSYCEDKLNEISKQKTSKL